MAKFATHFLAAAKLGKPGYLILCWLSKGMSPIFL